MWSIVAVVDFVKGVVQDELHISSECQPRQSAPFLGGEGEVFLRIKLDALSFGTREFLESGDFAIIGIDITEAGKVKLPPTAGCGPDERIVLIPRNLLVGAKRDIPDKV